jgi:hypothetical protein
MLTPKQRHRLLLADRTRDVAWITAVVEHVLAADPTLTLAEVETAFRDAGGSACVVARRDVPTGFVIVIGMPAWRSALDRAGVTAAENRAALVGKPLTAT